MKKLKCYYHPKESVSNFCVDQECSLPLCPLCIQTHIEEHAHSRTLPSILPYSEAFLRAQQHYSRQSQLYQELAGGVQFGEVGSILLHQIQKAMQETVNMVKVYFEQLQARAKEALLHSQRLEGAQLKALKDKTSQRLARIRRQLAELEQGAVQPIIKFFARSETSNSQFQQLSQNFEQSVAKMPRLYFNQQAFKTALAGAFCIDVKRQPLVQTNLVQTRVQPTGQRLPESTRKDLSMVETVRQTRMEQLKRRLGQIQNQNKMLAGF